MKNNNMRSKPLSYCSPLSSLPWKTTVSGAGVTPRQHFNFNQIATENNLLRKACGKTVGKASVHNAE